MKPLRFDAQLVRAEYGIWPDADGRRHWLRITRAPEAIGSANHYHRACLRVAAANLTAEETAAIAALDHRLVKAGWNTTSPKRWILDGLLWEFVGYWNEGAHRPHIVGSEYNPCSLQTRKAQRLGIPPKLWGKLQVLPAWLQVRSARTRLSEQALPRLRALAAHAGRQRSIHHRDQLLAERARLANPKLQYALGRLCPELWRVAVETLPCLPDGRKSYRVQDVDWMVVQRVERQLAVEKTGRLRAGLSAGRRQEKLTQRVLVNHGPLCPAYPEVRTAVAHLLNTGATPVQVARSLGVELSKQEAHGWLLARAPEDIVQWLQHRLLGGWMHRHGVNCRFRDPTTLRWAHRQAQRPEGSAALLLERTFQGPGGQLVTGRFADRLDEVQVQDLEGTRQGVQAVFERTIVRMGNILRDRLEKDSRVLAPTPPQLTRRVLGTRARVLATNHDLAVEGEQLNHCVYGYGQAVADQASVIIALWWGKHRSTVELRGPKFHDWERGVPAVLQHHGVNNGDPPEVLKRLLASLLRRLGRGRSNDQPAQPPAQRLARLIDW